MSGIQISYAIEKYGTPAKTEGKAIHILLRPLRTTKENGEEYWCAAKAGSRLIPGCKIHCREKHLVVIRSDAVLQGGRPLYEWAILREEQGAFSAA